MPRIKEVDCALIFMLDEERDLFLDNNQEFMLTTKKNNQFIEFIFFDKKIFCFIYEYMSDNDC